MSDWHDYNNNLAFEPQGDWSETQPKSCTDRTPQVLQLIDRVAKLEKQLKIAVKFIGAYSRYVPKVKTPKDFNVYEAVWFLFRTEAEQTLKQIEELEK